MFALTKRSARAVILAMAMAVFVGACAPGAKSPGGVSGGSPQVKPELVRSASILGAASLPPNMDPVSPDGQYAAVVRTTPQGMDLAAVSLWDADVQKTLHSVSKDHLSQCAFSYVPLGWTGDTELLFAIFGWQNSGPHEDMRGIAILKGDVADSSSTEEAFLELAYDFPLKYLIAAKFTPASGKAFFAITGAIWEYDLAQARFSLVRDGLPIPESTYCYPEFSPDGRYCVYGVRDGHRDGVYLLDLNSGEETPLATDGDFAYFYPAWSPDSTQVAMYAANRLEGRPGTSWSDYDIVPGEDGPWPTAGTIALTDVVEKTLSIISVPGKLLSGMRWSGDSKSLAFLGCRLQGVPSGQSQDASQRQLSYEDVYLVFTGGSESRTGEPQLLARLAGGGQGPSAASVSAVDPSGTGVYYTIGGEYPVSWYAKKGGTPVKLEPQDITTVDSAISGAPITYGEHLVAITRAGGKTKLGLLKQGAFTAFAEFEDLQPVSTVWVDRETLAVCRNSDDPSGAGSASISLYRMYPSESW